MLEKFRTRLAAAEALPHLLVIALFSGVIAGFVIILFRLLIENLQASFLPAGQPENYEGLAPIWRLLLPTIGGLLVGLFFQFANSNYRGVGIVHVMERLGYHQGYLPLPNAIYQFFGAAICIIFGHSVGREGPTVHLGAASGSLLGQGLSLPNNSIRILVACGTSAAIAASFNTPLAGVIFAMEVVMIEYTVVSFMPVILSAVIGAVMTRWVFGPDPAFHGIPLSSVQNPQIELFYLPIVGLLIGLLATMFISSLQFFAKSVTIYPIWQRMTIAGLMTGIVALFVPQVMGIGYDTVNAIFLEEVNFLLLLIIVLAKLFVTTLGLGLGLPGGLIGPTLIIGAAAGGMMGLLAQMFLPVETSSSALYAMLGMGAMMSATLQAPLAGLMALLELTANPNIILPGMLVIVIANLISSQKPLAKSSVFLVLLRARGLDYRTDPVEQSLRRVGVVGVMEENFVILPRHVPFKDAEEVLNKHPLWIVIAEQKDYRYILPATDLAHYLHASEIESHKQVDLIAMPAQRQELTAIHYQATLQEALEILNQKQADALYIYRPDNLRRNNEKDIYGILTKKTIEMYYRH